MTKHACFAVGLCVLSFITRPLFAAPVDGSIPARVVVDVAAPVFVQPNAITPLRVAKEGSILKVRASQGKWYLVEFDDPASGRRLGYIERSQVSAVQLDEPLDLTIAEARNESVTPASLGDPGRGQAPQGPGRRDDPTARSWSRPWVPAWETSASWGLAQSSGETYPRGWNLSIAGSLTPWLSTVGEFSGLYTSVNNSFADIGANDHMFLGGVRGVGRLADGRVSPFAQFLAGVHLAHAYYNSKYYAFLNDTASDVGFVIQPGGGVDIGLSDSVAIRLQIDYPTNFEDGTNSYFRFSPGIVIRSGRR